MNENDIAKMKTLALWMMDLTGASFAAHLNAGVDMGTAVEMAQFSVISSLARWAALYSDQAARLGEWLNCEELSVAELNNSATRIWESLNELMALSP